MGKSWENHGIIGKIVGNCGKMWDNHVKIMGKCRIIRENHENMQEAKGGFEQNHRTIAWFPAS